jgi:deazaflavin-dependent oxidoreductase (nitroreductase family)
MAEDMTREERVQKLAVRNARAREEFRANGGVTERYGKSLIIMHTLGAKTGLEREIPVVARPEDGGWVVLAAVQGAPNNPDWYYNLVANPEILVEHPGASGVETSHVRVDVVPPEKWEAEFEAVCAVSPAFREMQARTTRRIPILHLRRLGPGTA